MICEPNIFHDQQDQEIYQALRNHCLRCEPISISLLAKIDYLKIHLSLNALEACNQYSELLHMPLNHVSECQREFEMAELSKHYDQINVAVNDLDFIQSRYGVKPVEDVWEILN
ncbi:hypothetical protein [Hydrogenovibrio halophilus]|uniref:hypothetical protein n=1 Tax=Hydrogenovibrio halophilus TaxID=373391 RepID=UPI00038186C9|nr:hypothetical protein [Hydrogenovibrio halophilus]